MVKNLPAVQETQVQSLGQEDPLKKGMATHSSILVLRVPWAQGPGRLLSMGSQRVGHDWETFIFIHTQEYLDSKRSEVGLASGRVESRNSDELIWTHLFPVSWVCIPLCRLHSQASHSCPQQLHLYVCRPKLIMSDGREQMLAPLCASLASISL